METTITTFDEWTMLSRLMTRQLFTIFSFLLYTYYINKSSLQAFCYMPPLILNRYSKTLSIISITFWHRLKKDVANDNWVKLFLANIELSTVKLHSNSKQFYGIANNFFHRLKKRTYWDLNQYFPSCRVP